MEKGTFRLEVTAEDAEKRLDKFLTDKLPGGHSRSFIQKLIDTGNVLVDGVVKNRHFAVKVGDSVAVMVPEPKGVDMKPESIPLDIVYEDEDLLVVNKSADMVVHPAPGNWTGTLVNALMAHCKDLSGIGGELKPGIVHRIDKGTTGLLVVAKNDKTHGSLSKQFKAKATTRVYIAVVKGVVQFDNGVVELPIGRDETDRRKMAVDLESEKEAVTRYKVIERFADSTILELRLGTGRTHQIRVHMAHIGHPVVGDETYGTHTRYHISRPALHAKTIGFTHPSTGKYVEFTSELPGDMRKLIAELRSGGSVKVSGCQGIKERKAKR